MLYGAGLSVLASLLLVVFAAKERRARVLAMVGLVAFVPPICWNLILRRTGATGPFSHDLPFRPFPVSWQDTGSGVFTLAARGRRSRVVPRSMRLRDSARRLARLALCTALGAFLIDSYAY